MTSMIIAPALGPDAVAWLVPLLAAAGGVVLHVLLPPQNPDIAEALLTAAAHP